MTPELKARLADVHAEHRDRQSEETWVGSVFTAEEAHLHRYLDMGWTGTGWPPSALLVIGESLLVGGDNGTPASKLKCAQKAKTYRDAMIAEARKRWKAGYYADPFTNEPKLRSGTLAGARA